MRPRTMNNEGRCCLEILRKGFQFRKIRALIEFSENGHLSLRSATSYVYFSEKHYRVEHVDINRNSIRAISVSTLRVSDAVRLVNEYSRNNSAMDYETASSTTMNDSINEKTNWKIRSQKVRP